MSKGKEYIEEFMNDEKKRIEENMIKNIPPYEDFKIVISYKCNKCGNINNKEVSNIDLTINSSSCECCGTSYSASFDVKCDFCGHYHDLNLRSDY